MESKLMSKTFIWMFIGLLVTFITGYGVASNETMIINIYKNSIYIVLCIVELILVIFLSTKVHSMSKNMARICFIIYSFVTGLSLSSIFVIYSLSSILYVFLIAAVVFLVFGLLGYFTKLDLTKLGTYLMMILFGVIVCFLVNLFLNYEQFDFVLTLVSMVVFMGFTAYDVQKIKRLAENSTIPEDNLSIVGALNLYLDYINIFLDLLNLLGKSKD
ncbi:MAG: Bax inhibitor-1/YccA family protein [Bacilli bacterium]|nr:Bax inhibitor-1/YccA family protein [Bacilli bacterium]